MNNNISYEVKNTCVKCNQEFCVEPPEVCLPCANNLKKDFFDSISNEIKKMHQEILVNIEMHEEKTKSFWFRFKHFTLIFLLIYPISYALLLYLGMPFLITYILSFLYGICFFNIFNFFRRFV